MKDDFSVPIVTDEAPPTYQEAKESGETSPPAYQRESCHEEDPYAFVTENDTVFVIQDSGPSFSNRHWGQLDVRVMGPHSTTQSRDGIDIFVLSRKGELPNQGGQSQAHCARWWQSKGDRACPWPGPHAFIGGADRGVEG